MDAQDSVQPLLNAGGWHESQTSEITKMNMKQFSQQVKPIEHLIWNAAQGVQSAQKELSTRIEISQEQRDFWRYKSEGGEAFSVESEGFRFWQSRHPRMAAV